MVSVVPRTFLQPHSVGRRQASSMYSGGGRRPGRLPYTPGRASDRLVEVLSTFSVFTGLRGRLPYTPLGRCLLASRSLFDACSDLDVGGEEIFFSCCLFSDMAPERVLPSPPSDGGLLRGKEVVRNEILEVVGEGGEDVMLPLSRLVQGGLDARRAWCRWPSWARSVRSLLRLTHP